LLTLKSGDKPTIRLEAPLAFQSSLAGILLASELYLWKAGYRTQDFPVMTHIYPLFPLNPESNPYHHGVTKDLTNRCICTDQDYRLVYSKKWGSVT